MSVAGNGRRRSFEIIHPILPGISTTTTIHQAFPARRVSFSKDIKSSIQEETEESKDECPKKDLNSSDKKAVINFISPLEENHNETPPKTNVRRFSLSEPMKIHSRPATRNLKNGVEDQNGQNGVCFPPMRSQRRATIAALPKLPTISSTEGQNKQTRRLSLFELPFVDDSEPIRVNSNESDPQESNLPTPTCSRPLSVTPIPDIIQQQAVPRTMDAATHDQPVSESLPSYAPKYCWCMRCHMMYYMFQAGDPRLEDWGNYPCFRR